MLKLNKTKQQYIEQSCSCVIRSNLSSYNAWSANSIQLLSRNKRKIGIRSELDMDWIGLDWVGLYWVGWPSPRF